MNIKEVIIIAHKCDLSREIVFEVGHSVRKYSPWSQNRLQ